MEERDRKTLPGDRGVGIPEDVMFHKILPQLPCKALARLKAVSRAYETKISDPHFATLQSRDPSPFSAGFVYLEDRSGLSFLSQLDTIGVPDPSLNFLPIKSKSPTDAIALLSSTNGILLVGRFSDEEEFDICVCNPATMESEVLPKGSWRNKRDTFIMKPVVMGLGLAFDPRAVPERYAIVNAINERTLDGTRYTFDVFNSQIGAWKPSKEEIYFPGLINDCPPLNPVYSRGVLYWDCMEHLIWFDPENDLSGTILLPHHKDKNHVRKYVEVFEHEDICCMCVTSEGGIEVWILTDNIERWEKKYALSLEKLIHESVDNLYFGLPDAKMPTGYPVESFVMPLAFDGRNAYVAACTRVWLSVRDFAVLERESENAGDSSPDYTDRRGIDCAENNNCGENNCGAEVVDQEGDKDKDKEDLFCCDMVTGKVISMKRSVVRTERNYRILHYWSSLVALPPVLK